MPLEEKKKMLSLKEALEKSLQEYVNKIDSNVRHWDSERITAARVISLSLATIAMTQTQKGESNEK